MLKFKTLVSLTTIALFSFFLAACGSDSGDEGYSAPESMEETRERTEESWEDTTDATEEAWEDTTDATEEAWEETKDSAEDAEQDMKDSVNGY